MEWQTVLETTNPRLSGFPYMTPEKNHAEYDDGNRGDSLDCEAKGFESQNYEPEDANMVADEFDFSDRDWASTFEMSNSLRQFSKGLKDIFWGTMALMGGIVLFFGFPFLAANGGFAVGARFGLDEEHFGLSYNCTRRM